MIRRIHVCRIWLNCSFYGISIAAILNCPPSLFHKEFYSNWGNQCVQDDKAHHIAGVKLLADDEEKGHHFFMTGLPRKSDAPSVFVKRIYMNIICCRTIYGLSSGRGASNVYNLHSEIWYLDLNATSISYICCLCVLILQISALFCVSVTRIDRKDVGNVISDKYSECGSIYQKQRTYCVSLSFSNHRYSLVEFRWYLDPRIWHSIPLFSLKMEGLNLTQKSLEQIHQRCLHNIWHAVRKFVSLATLSRGVLCSN